jgi:hypothetical protein
VVPPLAVNIDFYRYLRCLSISLSELYYCKILSKVISAAKHRHYNEIIRNSENKIKSTWKIVTEERGKTSHSISEDQQ